MQLGVGSWISWDAGFFFGGKSCKKNGIFVAEKRCVFFFLVCVFLFGNNEAKKIVLLNLTGNFLQGAY